MVYKSFKLILCSRECAFHKHFAQCAVDLQRYTLYRFMLITKLFGSMTLIPALDP